MFKFRVTLKTIKIVKFFIFIFIFNLITFSSFAVILDGNVLDNDLAVCNNGSKASYYIKKNDPKKWAVLIKGGGAAGSDKNYLNRTQEQTKSWVKDLSMLTIKLGSITDSFNRLNYSIIYLPYCSSDVHAGTHKRKIEGKDVYFHGKYIFESLLKKYKTELSKADDLVIGGYSAGSIAVGMNLQKIKEINNPNIRFLLDSYWLDKSEIKPRKKLSNAKRLKYAIPNFPKDCKDWTDCYPSKKRLTKYGFKSAFIVWNEGDHFRMSKNDKQMRKYIKEDIEFFGGGISLSRDIVIPNQKSQHVILFYKPYNSIFGGIEIKKIFENWLSKNGNKTIGINF